MTGTGFPANTVDTIFEPGDPPRDIAALDLPPGSYQFHLIASAQPEYFVDQDGNPAGVGPGGSIECRFFDESPDGTRAENPAISVGGWATGLTGPLGIPALASGQDSATEYNVFEPDTRAVLVCEHTFGDGLVEFNVHWTAVTVDSVEYQLPLLGVPPVG